MLFSIDHGNSAVKTPNFTFTSGLADYPVRPPVEMDVLEYGGKFWTLSGQRIPYMRDKTKDDRYFILTLFAIAKELQRTGMIPPMVETDLVVGLPPEHYALRRKFAEYFKRDAVRFRYNNTPICLIIQQVLVYPQAYAAVVPQAALLKESPRTFIIDVGGYTTDVMLLRNSAPDMQFCRSIEMGVISMSNNLIGKISAQYDIKIDDDHIADVIQGRPTILPDEVREAIFTAVKAYANNILDKLRELQVDLRANPAIFVGGGAALFKPFLQDSPLVAKADFVLEQRANAAYTGPRAPSARSISPTLPERSPTIPRAVLEERPCQPRRRAEPGISHRSRGWGCRWQSKQSPVIECDSGKSVIPPAWHRRFPRIPVPLHAGSSNPIQGHRGNRRD